MSTPVGTVQLPKMDGLVINEYTSLIEEPTPIPGTNKLRCLANCSGNLCLVELSIKFGEKLP